MILLYSDRPQASLRPNPAQQKLLRSSYTSIFKASSSGLVCNGYELSIALKCIVYQFHRSLAMSTWNEHVGRVGRLPARSRAIVHVSLKDLYYIHSMYILILLCYNCCDPPVIDLEATLSFHVSSLIMIICSEIFIQNVFLS